MAGHLIAIYLGLPYQTTDLAEAPSYTIQRYLAPGEIAPATNFTLSTGVSDYIKTQTGYSQYVTVGANNILEIGYGHQISVNETIAGTLFDADTIQTYIQTGGLDQLTYLSLSDADAVFATDMQAVETFIGQTMTCSLTQSQFDALCSFVFQIGISQIQAGAAGLDVINALNLGRMDIALARLSANVYVNGLVDPNTVARRQDERDLMGQFTDPLSYGAVPVTGTALQVGQFLVDPAVKTAIDAAATNNSVDRKFAYTMVSQLSGFNPTATNPTTGAMGLFMLSPAVTTQYGIVGLELDPVSNATAACQFIADATAEFLAVNSRNPTPAELFVSMLLGQTAGAQYAQIVANNPTGIASYAIDMLVPGLTGAFPLLFANDETNAGFMAYLGAVFADRYATFS